MEWLWKTGRSILKMLSLYISLMLPNIPSGCAYLNKSIDIVFLLFEEHIWSTNHKASNIHILQYVVIWEREVWMADWTLKQKTFTWDTMADTFITQRKSVRMSWGGGGEEGGETSRVRQRLSTSSMKCGTARQISINYVIAKQLAEYEHHFHSSASKIIILPLVLLQVEL